jgi:hypothetical protein
MAQKPLPLIVGQALFARGVLNAGYGVQNIVDGVEEFASH